MEPASTYKVREMQVNDIAFIKAYWLESEPEFLTGMGVDLDKLPEGNKLEAMLQKQLETPYQEKGSYALIWEERKANGERRPIGHCNANGIEFGVSAFMHLHLWQARTRKKGLGTQLVKGSLPFFFQNLQLNSLYCQPYALNPAPNKTLEKVGFAFEKRYTTIPGSLNFEQEVSLWVFRKEWLGEAKVP